MSHTLGVRATVGPRLIYDGDCAFCTRVAHWAADKLGSRAAVVAWQRIDLSPLGLTDAQCSTEVQWVDADGRVSGGHRAVARALATMGGAWRVLAIFIVLPGVSTLAALAYRLVARNRYRLPGGTDACKL